MIRTLAKPFYRKAASLGGSTVFENTLRQFKAQHPGEAIQHIYTVPGPLKLKKADALIFYIVTEDRA